MYDRGSRMTNLSSRVSLLLEEMQDSQIDSVIIPLGINFRWLFGVLERPSERLLIGIIDDEDKAKMLVPSFEADRIKRITGITNIITWEETQNPFDILASIMSSQKGKKIGIEPKMWYSTFEQIANVLSENSFISVEPIFNRLRSVKDEGEQELLIKASQKTGNAITRTLEDLEIGISEMEAQSILNERLKWGNNEDTFSLVQFGENSSLPHYHGGKRRLRRDDVILIDAGGTLDNYWGDITITCVFGDATTRFKEIYDIVYNANRLGKEAVEQNKLPSEIDAAARNYIRKKGFGNLFTHRTGHGLGLEVHEHPYIVGNNKNALVQGNVFSIEPGIYIPGKFGVRIEDDVVKTSIGIRTSEILRYEILEI